MSSTKEKFHTGPLTVLNESVAMPVADGDDDDNDDNANADGDANLSEKKFEKFWICSTVDNNGNDNDDGDDEDDDDDDKDDDVDILLMCCVDVSLIVLLPFS